MVAKIDRPPMTPAQERTYRAIVEYISEHGREPTMQALADKIGLSKTTIFLDVRELKSKGWLIQGLRHHGSQIKPVDPPDRCPYCGHKNNRNIFGADDLREQLAEVREKIEYCTLLMNGHVKPEPGPLPDLMNLRSREAELVCRIHLATFKK